MVYYSYMTYLKSSKIKRKAIALRKLGYSLGEIALKLHISKSTASLWLKDVKMNVAALTRLNQSINNARLKGSNKKRRLHLDRLKRVQDESLKFIHSFDLHDQKMCKLLCSFLYWGEGGKVDLNASFINSDNKMVKTYVFLLRKAFKIDERKFRALVHIHDYHNEEKVKKYWSKITKIPLTQFTKSYRKPHSGRNKHPGYMGTIKIKYYDVQIANELKAIYNTLADKLGP